jgi:hypothetical protein
MNDLPKVTKKKLIDEKSFVKNAEKVKKILEQEAEFLLERKLRNGNNLPQGTLNLS